MITSMKKAQDLTLKEKSASSTKKGCTVLLTIPIVTLYMSLFIEKLLNHRGGV